MIKHGISMGIERSNKNIYLTLKLYGKLTHEDYQQLTPFIENAIASAPKNAVNMLVDILELEGWEVHAAWDDLKLGLKHNQDFIKIALLGNDKWHNTAAKVGNWFVSGELKYFEDSQTALTWLYK